MTLEAFQTKPSESEVSSQFTQEQLEILELEYAERLVNEELRNEEYDILIDEYQTKHRLSRQDAITILSRNRLEY